MKMQMTVLSFVLLSIFCLNAFAAEDVGKSVLAQGGMPLVNDQKSGQIGVGLQFGNFSGVSAEYWATNSRAFTAALTASNGGGAVSFGHNWFFRHAFRDVSISPYVGAAAMAAVAARSGPFNRDHQGFASAIQIPLGLELLPLNQRFSVFGEIVPSLEVTPIRTGFTTADAGVRLYF